MKGLLLKDVYMTAKYCRTYLLIAAVFVAASLVSETNSFFLFYPCLLCGMIPITLISYDESSRWQTFCGALPVTKAQQVSCKYLIGLAAQACMLIVTGVAQGFRMRSMGAFAPKEFWSAIASTFILSAAIPSVCLPLIFKLGVEKGRIAYLFIVGLVCGVSFVGADFFQTRFSAIAHVGTLSGMCLLGALIYALSWRLSIVFYTGREV